LSFLDATITVTNNNTHVMLTKLHLVVVVAQCFAKNKKDAAAVVSNTMAQGQHLQNCLIVIYLNILRN